MKKYFKGEKFTAIANKSLISLSKQQLLDLIEDLSKKNSLSELESELFRQAKLILNKKI